MDILKAAQTYIHRMATEVPGMKVLLLDAHTTPIVSLVTTQTELLSHEIYLTDRIDNVREPLHHLSCIAFLSPQSVEHVKRELADPRYGSYWLYFSNTLTKSQIEEMATTDELEAVKEVQEYFADYLAQQPFLFSLTQAALADGGDEPPNPPIFLPAPMYIPPSVINSHQRAILAALLSLKKRPVIRWEKMSQAAKKLATEIQASLSSDLFDFRPTTPAPLLLILDRRNDPVTPLLSQWTYQAMLHELCGINNGRVRIEGDGADKASDLVLADPFYSQHLFANFGDLGAAVAAYVSDYQNRANLGTKAKIETVADMKRFVEEYPEFKRLGGNVTKHVTLVGELSRRVERDELLAVSEVEQSLASQESHQADLKSVMNLLASPRVPKDNKLRLAILYALRYQKAPGNQISQVVDSLIVNGISADKARLVYVMLNFAGADVRQDDLFANETFFSKGKSALKGLTGVENVYTQHTPHLSETLDLLLKGRLRETSYPFLGAEDRNQRPQDIIVFMIGGTTYEEARAVALLNQKLAHEPGGGTRILLGGSTVHNSASFLDMVTACAEHFPPAIYGPPIASAFAPSAAAAGAVPPGAPSSGLNLRAGGYELSVGGPAGSGLYRSSHQGASFQLPHQATQVAEGIRDGAGRLWGNVLQKVEDRVSRTGSPNTYGR